MKPRINIKASSPYLPLFQRGGTRYKLILGGRGSAKSFTVATALIDRTYDDDGTILFTRYTLVNAEVSILPEFVDKIERLGLQGDFTKSGNDLVNIRTGGRILFRGIKTSSGINTAALKSIPKLKMWVNDESEELVDETIFDTIDLSIRYNDAPAEVWLVANPPDIDHFLYRRFFKQRGIEDVWNGVKDDVTYIWTTYLTNPYLPDEYVQLAERSKAVDMAYYEHVWLGHFATHKEGLIYKGWKEVGDEEWPLHLPCWYGVDWGFANDPAAVLRVAYDPETHTVWLRELLYETGMLTADIARVIRKDIRNRWREISVGDRVIMWHDGRLWERKDYEGGYKFESIDLSASEDAFADAGFKGWEVSAMREAVAAIERCDGEIYCDPARPEQIREMKINHGLWAMPAVNTDKVGRIEYLKYFDVCFIGANIRQEVNAYCWQTSKNDKTQYINKPQDGGDHCFVGGTRVITWDGVKPIKDVRTGDFVLTSVGWRNVLNFFDNGYKKVLVCYLFFCNFIVKIEATENHLFKTTKGWKQLKDLRAGDMLYLPKCSTEKSIANTRARSIIQDTTNGCTAWFGNITTGQSPKGITSTIKTAILRITTLIIWSWLKARSIFTRTSRNESPTPKNSPNCENGCGWRASLRRRGTRARKGDAGIANTPKHKSESSGNTLAPFAARCTAPKIRHQSTAPQNATQRHGGIAGLITKRESANNAGESSRLTNTTRNDFAAAVAVRSIVVHSERKERVYDITVEGAHEFFANGLLVHNCMDAASYGVVTHLRRLGIANKLGEQ